MSPLICRKLTEISTYRPDLSIASTDATLSRKFSEISTYRPNVSMVSTRPANMSKNPVNFDTL